MPVEGFGGPLFRTNSGLFQFGTEVIVNLPHQPMEVSDRILYVNNRCKSSHDTSHGTQASKENYLTESALAFSFAIKPPMP